MRTPGGSATSGRRHSGRHIEFTYKPLADGSLLGVSIATSRELKEREQAQADAKEAAEMAPRRSRARTRRGGSRQPGEVHLPRHHEPRDPHADERRARHDGGARPAGLDAGQQRTSRPCATPRRRCCASSTMCSTSRRSRPAGSNWKPRRSRSPGLIDGVLSTFQAQAAAKGLDADRRDRARLGRHADRRPDARAADPVQSARQCAEIHRARPHHGDAPRPRRSAAGARA